MADAIHPIVEFLRSLTLMDAICAPGLVLFGVWLLRTSWGRKALADSRSRANHMPAFLPFIPLFFWLGGVALAMEVAHRLGGESSGWRSAFIDNVIYSVGALLTVALIVAMVRTSFEGKLRGLGLKVRNIARDIPASVANLLAIWPFVILAILLTMQAGRILWGPDYKMEQHEELRLIAEHSELPLRISVFVVAVVLAPVLEEMLFRGMFQTMIRSHLLPEGAPERSAGQRSRAVWLSIAVGAGLFAMVHANTGHWPALFVLGLCLGYSYEKSGSLFRPIFIHALFNGITVVSTIYQQGGSSG